MIGPRLRLITAWSLLVGAFGVWLDARLSWDNHQGSWGLIPAYLGTIVGLACYVFVVGKVASIWLAILTGLGVASMFVFWGSYPESALFGGIGSLLIGIAVLYLPSRGRWASPLWIASGTLGLPALVRPGVTWGPVSSFTILGAALAVTGTFVLLGLPQADESTDSRPRRPLSGQTTGVERVKADV